VGEPESGWPLIRAELEAILRHREALPNMHDISKEQAALTFEQGAV
jgi:hypothetical protein